MTKEDIKDIGNLLLILLIGIACVLIPYALEHQPPPIEKVSPPPIIDTIPDFMGKGAKEGLREALLYYEVHHPDIVYAQAVLETGNFKSYGCTNDNNLFGLYNSKLGKYHKFNHWHESVISYKHWIQRRYKPPEDYYKFLKRIGYASDPLYTNKLKSIIRHESERSKGAGVATDTTTARQ